MSRRPLPAGRNVRRHAPMSTEAAAHMHAARSPQLWRSLLTPSKCVALPFALRRLVYPFVTILNEKQRAYTVCSHT